MLYPRSIFVIRLDLSQFCMLSAQYFRIILDCVLCRYDDHSLSRAV